MVRKAKKFGMSACGLTDHGTLTGVIDFLRICREEEIRPILGIETYFAKNHKTKTKELQPAGRKGNRHLTLIAKNSIGFQNICTLSQIASLEGFYYDPRVDAELLTQYSEGVIATSGCLSGIVNHLLLKDKFEEAKKAAGLFKDIYGEDYYLEMMYHGIDEEAKILPEIQKLSKLLNIKIISTQDSHYLEQEEAEFHEIIMCISSGKTIKDPRRLKFPYKEFYFKSKEEMFKIFGHVPDYLQNTMEIAEKCDYSDIIFIEKGGSMKLPKFSLPTGYNDPYLYLTELAWKGFKKLGMEGSEIHKERLKMELDDIKLVWDTKRYDFTTYFLIVEDIMRFAKEKGIDAGIRGSGYGSLLLKCLGVIESPIDPIKFNLLWSRFLGFSDQKFFSEQDFYGPI